MRALRGSLPRLPLAFLLVFLTAAGACWLGLAGLRGRFVIERFAAGDNPPVPVERIRLKDRASYPAHFLLLHGYVANRRHLFHLAEVLASAGGDVYVADLPGRGDHAGPASPLGPDGPTAQLPTPHETEAALTVARELEESYSVQPAKLVVVGHSMGGGVALEVGSRIGPAAVVSLAGLERPVAPGPPGNLLLITATLEIPPLREAADRMYTRSREGGTAERQEFPGTHSSLPFLSSVQRAVVSWTNRALPEAQLQIPAWLNLLLLGLEAATLLLLTALFVPLAQVGAWALALDRDPLSEVVPETRASLWSFGRLAGYGVLAGASAASLLGLLAWLGWTRPLSFVGLEQGNYLVAFLLLVTAPLLRVFRWRPWVRSWNATLTRVGLALLLAAYLVGAGGSFMSWQLFDIWPTWGRLARFPVLLVLLFPYVLGEEILLRTFARRGDSGAHFRAFLLWRVVLLGTIVYAAKAFPGPAGLLVLLIVPLLVLSLILYFLSDVLYRVSGSPYAVAAFNLVLLAWFVATVFPLG